MRFKQYKYVLKVAEERNFSTAAKKLFISQPSLSQFIQKIEEQIGASLFDRSVSPLKPTYVGELYIEHAKQIIDLQNQFEQKVDDVLKVKKGKVIVGASPFRSAYLISQLLPQFRKNYPDIEIFLKEDNTGNLEELTLNGETDIAISLLPIDERLFDYEILFEEKILLALPPSHPIAKKLNLFAGEHNCTPHINLAEFCDTPFIQMNKNHKLHKMLLTLCDEAGFIPKVIFETDNMITAQALAGADIAASLLPESLIYANHFKNEPCYCLLNPEVSRTVLVIYRKGRYLSKATRAFIKELKDFVEQHPKNWFE